METTIPIEVLATRRYGWIERATPRLATIVRCGLAILFGATSIAKLVSGERFVDAVIGYGLVPVSAADLAASAVTVLEMTLAVWLASGRACRLSLASTGCVCLTLAAVVGAAWWRGTTGDCGCFSGVAESSIGPGAILRSAAIASLALLAAAVERPRAIQFQLKDK